MSLQLFENVKKLARNKNLSLRELAQRANMGESSIYNWKTHDPSADKLQKVANILGVSVTKLLGNEEEKEEEHIDVSKILEANQLYMKNTALSDDDRLRIQSVLSALLNSPEGQERLRKRGYKGGNNK